MKFTFLTIALTCAATSLLPAQFKLDPPTTEENAQTIIGHNGLTYRVIRDWAKVTREEAPVINAHAMVEGSDGLFYLVTDHPQNAVLIFKPDGTFVKAIGKNLKGGHGIDVIKDEKNNRELLVHVDAGWKFTPKGKVTKIYGSINILTKEGELVRTFPSPIELGLEKEGSFYGPCDVAITPNNEILVVDGYGSNRVLHFNLEGKLIRHWGGRKKGTPEDINNGHGISIDHSDPEKPIVWISSRNENRLKRFSLEGDYLGKVALPGAYAGQAVFHKDHIYTGVCWSKDKETKKKLKRSGFVIVLDRKTFKALSVPGGSKPNYEGDSLKPLWQEYKTFRHVHDLMVDKAGNIYVMEWNAGRRYPTKLELIKYEPPTP